MNDLMLNALSITLLIILICGENSIVSAAIYTVVLVAINILRKIKR